MHSALGCPCSLFREFIPWQICLTHLCLTPRVRACLTPRARACLTHLLSFVIDRLTSPMIVDGLALLLRSFWSRSARGVPSTTRADSATPLPMGMQLLPSSVSHLDAASRFMQSVSTLHAVTRVGVTRAA